MKTCQWVALGDSITLGQTNGNVSYVDKCVAAYAPLVGHTTKTAVGGSTCDSANQVPSAQALFNGSLQVNIASLDFGANDGGTKTAAQFVSDLKTACLTLRGTGFKIIVTSMLPCGAYDSAAFRTSSRALILADSSFWDQFVDFGNTGTTMGAEAAKNDISLYNDTVHPTDHGHVLLEPMMTPALRYFIEPPPVTGVARSRLQVGM